MAWPVNSLKTNRVLTENTNLETKGCLVAILFSLTRQMGAILRITSQNIIFDFFPLDKNAVQNVEKLTFVWKMTAVLF